MGGALAIPIGSNGGYRRVRLHPPYTFAQILLPSVRIPAACGGIVHFALALVKSIFAPTFQRERAGEVLAERRGGAALPDFFASVILAGCSKANETGVNKK